MTANRVRRELTLKGGVTTPNGRTRDDPGHIILGVGQ